MDETVDHVSETSSEASEGTDLGTGLGAAHAADAGDAGTNVLGTGLGAFDAADAADAGTNVLGTGLGASDAADAADAGTDVLGTGLGASDAADAADADTDVQGTGLGAAGCAADAGTNVQGTGLGAAGCAVDAGMDVQGAAVTACAQSVFLRAAAGLGAVVPAPDPAGFGLSRKKLNAQGICWPSEQPVRQPGSEATWRVFAADPQLHEDTVREDLVLGRRKGADDFPVFCRKVQHPFEIITDEHGEPVLDARSRPIAKRGWFVWARSVYRLARLHDNLAHSPQAHARLLAGNDIRFPWQTDGGFYMRKGAGAS